MPEELLFSWADDVIDCEFSTFWLNSSLFVIDWAKVSTALFSLLVASQPRVESPPWSEEPTFLADILLFDAASFCLVDKFVARSVSTVVQEATWAFLLFLMMF